MSISLEKKGNDVILNNSTASTLLATDSNKKIVSVSNTNASESTFLAGDLTWKTAGGSGSIANVTYLNGTYIYTNYNTLLTFSNWATSNPTAANLDQTSSRIIGKKYNDAISAGHSIYDIECLFQWSTLGANTRQKVAVTIDLTPILGSDDIFSSDFGKQMIAVGTCTDTQQVWATAVDAKKVKLEWFPWSAFVYGDPFIMMFSIRT